jgi:RimJ/RimL family protein N-acetyltransferase
MIKQLNKNDWREWKEIRLEALKKSPDSFLSSFEEENKTPDNMWAEQLENSIKFGYFINDEIVGCSGLSIEKATKISHTATLFGMYVKDGFRGSGVGLALVNFVKNYAKENHIKHLYLGCNAENRGAVKLYKKCGFKVYGTRPDYTKIDNKFYDDLTMMCEL